MRAWKLSVTLATAGLLLAGAASAEPAALTDQRHMVEIGAYGGAIFLSDDHQLYERGTVRQRPFDDASPAFGLRIAYLPWVWLGAEIEGGLMPATTGDAESDSAMLYTIRGHVLLQYPRRFAPMLLVGGGLLGISSGNESLGDDVDGAFHWGLAFKGYLTRWLALRIDGRHLVSGGTGGDFQSHFELLGGVSIVLGWKEAPPPDTDGDGVPDDQDECPTRPAKTDDGCPPDSDGDGLLDDEDKCPKRPAKTADGCPGDADGDGLPDDKDKCPRIPAKTADGCPPDSDGDGLRDDKDACPNIPAKTPDGCPGDRDNDGVLDHVDKCPDQPETRNGFQDADGCPDELPKKVKRFTGVIRGIRFELNKAIIRTSSYALLNKAAEVLKEYEDLRLLIVGHTCNIGTRDYNMDLSLRRAQAVKTYLVAQGVADDRLEVKGLGFDEPIASNKTERGRAKNRRIEFLIRK